MPPRPSPAASIFAALGDTTRLRLVNRLCKHGPQSTTKLTAGFPVTRQAITKHLRLMEKAGLVHSTRDGRETLWRLDQHRLAEAGRHLHLISKQWDEALGRLRDFVEN